MTFGKDQNMIGNQFWKLRKTHSNGGNKKGAKFTEEHKKRIGDANRGKKRSDESRKNLGEAKKGKPIPHLKKYQFKKGQRPSNFVDGTSSQRYHQLASWKEIAKKVYKRDNWECQQCGKHGGILNAHHVIPWVISKDNSLDNLITLCVPCHSKIHQLNRDEKGRWKN